MRVCMTSNTAGDMTANTARQEIILEVNLGACEFTVESGADTPSKLSVQSQST